VRAGILALIVTYTLGQAARAEGTVPTQFVIGYDDEVSSSSFIANVVDLIHPRYFPLLASCEPNETRAPPRRMMPKSVTFYSEGVKLAGDLFLPADIKPGERRAGIVLCQACSPVLGLRRACSNWSCRGHRH